MANAAFIEKLVHVNFFAVNIKKCTDALSCRGEFFYKYYENDEGTIINCRALMMRIMAVVCHISFEDFENLKQSLNISLASVHKIENLCNIVNKSSVLENYPEDIFLSKEISNDIFLSDDMENFATSLFVELKMRLCPEQVFLDLFICLNSM